MDFTKKGPTGTTAQKLRSKVYQDKLRDMATGGGQCVGDMVANGMLREEQCKRPVPGPADLGKVPYRDVGSRPEGDVELAEGQP